MLFILNFQSKYDLVRLDTKYYLLKFRKKLERELEETNGEISEEFTDETLDRYSY